MAINYSSLLKFPKPDAGTAAWATYWHRAMDIAGNLSGRVVTVTKASGATTLPDADGTADTGKYPIIRTTQTLTGNVQVNIRAQQRILFADNRSSGGFTWKIQTASNSNGVSVPQGKGMWLRSTTTGVVPMSRTDGRSTATEIGLGVITATHLASNAITTVKITDANVTLPKLVGAGSYGRILVSATTAGFAWTTLARGTANQVLAMTTAAVTKPAWKTLPSRAIATSTGKSLGSAGDTISFTHGLTGVSNKYDYRQIIIAFECISADAGYSVGDVVYNNHYTDAGFGITVYADSTTAVKFVISSSGMGFHNKSSGAAAVFTLSRWVARFIVIV